VQLLNIQPVIPVSAFRIILYEISQKPDDEQAIPDTYVVDVAVLEIHTDMHPFGLCSGFLIPPWLTFPQAPFSSRTVSVGVTQPSLLILVYAPDPNPPVHLGFPYFDRSLQIATSLCWKMVLPNVIYAILV
jgi:hypothetical protein